MEISRMSTCIKILLSLIVFTTNISCKNNLSTTQYNHILDSLKQIDVPVLFDSVRFFKQRGTDIEIDSITPDGVIILESRDAFGYFYRQIRHIDSLFWNIYEYDKKGRLNIYYKKYIFSGADPTGYVVYYNQKGEAEDFSEGITSAQKTGLKAKFSIYDVINKLKKDKIDLFKHQVYISYTNRSGKINSKQLLDEYSWLIIINYFEDYDTYYKKISYQRVMRINPDNGDILEEWIDK